jgi:hypothetical protein
VIHAGRHWWGEARLGRVQAERNAERIAERLGLARPVVAYPRGALLGIVHVVGCFAFTEQTWERLRDRHGCDLAWSLGVVGWELSSTRRLACPVLYRGALGLFAVPAQLLGEQELEEPGT